MCCSAELAWTPEFTPIEQGPPDMGAERPDPGSLWWAVASWSRTFPGGAGSGGGRNLSFPASPSRGPQGLWGPGSHMEPASPHPHPRRRSGSLQGPALSGPSRGSHLLPLRPRACDRGVCWGTVRCSGQQGQALAGVLSQAAPEAHRGVWCAVLAKEWEPALPCGSLGTVQAAQPALDMWCRHRPTPRASPEPVAGSGASVAQSSLGRTDVPRTPAR